MGKTVHVLELWRMQFILADIRYFWCKYYFRYSDKTVMDPCFSYRFTAMQRTEESTGCKETTVKQWLIHVVAYNTTWCLNNMCHKCTADLYGWNQPITPRIENSWSFLSFICLIKYYLVTERIFVTAQFKICSSSILLHTWKVSLMLEVWLDIKDSIFHR